MNLRIALLAEYETAKIPVERISKELFGVSYEEARVRIKAGTFPLPAFQLLDSNKAPWFVSLEDLAAFIESRRDSAIKALEIPEDLRHKLLQAGQKARKIA